MKRATLIALLMLVTASPVLASGMFYREQVSSPVSPMTHQKIGVTFANGNSLTVVLDAGVNPFVLMNLLFDGTGCDYFPGAGLPDPCEPGDDLLPCSPFVTPCDLVRESWNEQGFPLEHGMDLLVDMPFDIRLVAYTDGDPSLKEGELPLVLDYPDDDIEVRMGVYEGPDDNMVPLIKAGAHGWGGLIQVTVWCKRIDPQTCKLWDPEHTCICEAMMEIPDHPIQVLLDPWLTFPQTFP